MTFKYFLPSLLLLCSSLQAADSVVLQARTPAQVAGEVEGSQFGALLARSGTTLAVAAPNEEVGDVFNAGAVHVYERGPTGEWVFKIRLTEPTPREGRHFGSAVALHNNTLLIGAAGGGAVDGAAFHTTRVSGEWQPVQLMPTQTFPNKKSLGAAVALHGFYAAIAAPMANIHSVTQAGFVQVYRRESEGGEWEAVMDISGNEANSLCGTGLALEHGNLLVGLPGYPDGNVQFAGKVLAYKLKEDGTAVMDPLRLPVPKAQRLFGFSLALKNGRALVGSAEAGRAYAYSLAPSGRAWTPIGSLSPTPAPAGLAFSFVDLQGEEAVVLTAHKIVNNEPTDGAVHVFSSTGAAWKQQTRVKHGAGLPAGSRPTAISLQGKEVVIGAQFQEGGKGAIHDFDLVKTGPEIVVSYDLVPFVNGVGQLDLGEDGYTYIMSMVEITNDGDAPLTFPSPPRAKGMSKGLRQLSFEPMSTLQPGERGYFSFGFYPGGAGPYGVTFEIPSNDPDEKVFSVRVTGVALPPPPPVFEVQPADLVTVYGNGGHLLSARAVTESSDVELRYVWKKAGKVIPGVTGETCPVNTTDMINPGPYTCEVSDGFTTVISNPANITLIRETSLFLRVQEGGTATFTSSVAGPFARYNWAKGDAATPVGTDSPTLTLTNVTPADSDTYHGSISTLADTDWSVTYGTLVVYNAAPTLTPVGSLPPARIGQRYVHQIQGLLTGLNSAVEIKASGLPKGLFIRSNGEEGWEITGTPEGAGGKSHAVTITASNKLGTVSTKTSLQVETLEPGIVGTYHGVIPRGPTLPLGGRLELTVTSTASFTGKFYLGSRTEAVKGIIVKSNLTGYYLTSDGTMGPRLITPKSGELVQASYDALLQPGNGTPSTFSMHLVAKVAGVMTGSSVSGPLWRTSTSGGDFQGLHNLAFKASLGNPELSPQGHGFASLTVAANGLAKLVGKTADGEALTASVPLGTGGQFPLHQALYRTPQKGSINGQLNLDSSRNISGQVSWTRPEDKAKSARLYKPGFGVPDVGLYLTVVGGAYTPPTTFLNPSTEPFSAALSFASAGIGSPSSGPGIDVTLLAGGKVQLPAAAQNPRKTSLSTVLKTGAFSGAFTLTDPNPAAPSGKPLLRTVKYQGLAVPENGQLQGYGYFLLPQLPTEEPRTTLFTSPIQSGAVLLGAD